MFVAGEHHCLTMETRLAVLPFKQATVQQFDRDLPVQSFVLGAPHRTGRTTANCLDQSVALCEQSALWRIRLALAPVHRREAVAHVDRGPHIGLALR